MRTIKDLPPLSQFWLGVCKIQAQKKKSYCLIFPSFHQLTLFGSILLSLRFNHIALFSPQSLLLSGNIHFKRQFLFVTNSDNEMPKSHKCFQGFNFTFNTTLTKLSRRNTIDIEAVFR